MGFQGGSAVKNPLANAEDTRDLGLIPGSGRSPGVGNGNSLQYSCLESSRDRGAWQATVQGVTKIQTRLSKHTHTHTHTHTQCLPRRVDKRLRETNTGGDKSFVVMTECLAMINFSCNLCSGEPRWLKGPGSRAGRGCEPRGGVLVGVGLRACFWRTGCLSIAGEPVDAGSAVGATVLREMEFQGQGIENWENSGIRLAGNGGRGGWSGGGKGLLS